MDRELINMTMKNSHFLMVLISFLASCNEIKKNVDNLHIDLDVSREIKMSEIFDDMDYLLIQEMDSIPIVQPYKVVFRDSLIFIEDNEQDNIFIVNRFNGKIQNVIKSAGSGPGEFNQVEDFQVRESEVVIKDVVSGKFISFDFQGKFLNEERVYNEATNFFKGDDFILHYFNNRPTEHGYNFLTINLQGDTLLHELANSIYFSSPTFNLDNGFQWDSQKQEIFLYHPNFYTVSFFSAKGNILRRKHFDFGKYSLPDLERVNYSNGAFSNDRDNFEKVHVKGIWRFFSFEETYIMTVVKGRREAFHMIMDKDFSPIIQISRWENDLDGMNHRNRPRFSTEEHLVVMTRSNRLYNDYQDEKESLLKNFPDAKIHSFIDQITEKLYDDRVAFIFYKLKSKAELEQLD